MRYSSNKQFNGLVNDLVARGWVFRRGTKHDQLKAPNGRLVVIPRTPSDWRSIRNAERDVRRALLS